MLAGQDAEEERMREKLPAPPGKLKNWLEAAPRTRRRALTERGRAAHFAGATNQSPPSVAEPVIVGPHNHIFLAGLIGYFPSITEHSAFSPQARAPSLLRAVLYGAAVFSSLVTFFPFFVCLILAPKLRVGQQRFPEGSFSDFGFLLAPP